MKLVVPTVLSTIFLVVTCKEGLLRAAEEELSSNDSLLDTKTSSGNANPNGFLVPMSSSLIPKSPTWPKQLVTQNGKGQQTKRKWKTPRVNRNNNKAIKPKDIKHRHHRVKSGSNIVHFTDKNKILHPSLNANLDKIRHYENNLDENGFITTTKTNRIEVPCCGPYALQKLQGAYTEIPLSPTPRETLHEDDNEKISDSSKAGQNLQRFQARIKQKGLKFKGTKVTQSTIDDDNIKVKAIDALVIKQTKEWLHDCRSAIDNAQNKSPFGCSSITEKIFKEYSVPCISLMYFFKSFPC